MEERAGFSVEEAEAERVRLDLERLFGPEVSFESAESESNSDAVSSFPPATNLHPEELYSYLEGEGLLRDPLTVLELVQSDSEAEHSIGNVRFWGDWRSRQVQLVRVDGSDRIRYITSNQPLIDTGEEIFVSRIWSRDQISEHTGFGALLEGRDGVYRAGIEVGREGFISRERRPEDLGVKGAVVELQNDLRRWKLQQDRQAVAFEKQFRLLTDILVEQRTAVKTVEGYALAIKTSLEENDLLQLSTNIDGKLQTYMESASGGQALLLKQEQTHFETVEKQMQGLMEAITSTKSAPVLDFQKAVDEMEVKIRTFGEVARESQTTLIREQEEERVARAARNLNLQISGLTESEEEDTLDTARRFLREDLKVASPQLIRASRVGRNDKGSRTILLRFTSMEGKNVVLGNRFMLKGKHIWIDSDLTPQPVDAKRKEVQKMKTAQEEGWIAFMRNDRAVITSRRRESS
ncbi:hypothetical protein R1sor_018025 [Riccia sorocarpa]|uniref:Uncharacterized protein n=1 Tax=Riccia sorocarpa TaxID=122646 RepID=A0ABD3I8I5_9MARC